LALEAQFRCLVQQDMALRLPMHMVPPASTQKASSYLPIITISRTIIIIHIFATKIRRIVMGCDTECPILFREHIV
jgi:hypothetical protein